MTERLTPGSKTLHTDEDGTELQISGSRLGFVSICLESPAGNRAQVFIPKHIADALLLAHSAGPGAVLRDVSALLDQVGREESHPGIGGKPFLYTREIRLKLGMLPPCGGTHPNLPGARCGLDEHLDPESWHVDTELSLRWRNPPGGNFEVRGVTQDDTDAQAEAAFARAEGTER